MEVGQEGDYIPIAVVFFFLTSFLYPVTWAATHRLRRVHLHFWTVGVVMEGAYQC